MNNRRNILIANDDGIQSPGIVRLAEAASNFGDVWVVAPEGQCSGMSQKLTIFNELNAMRRDFPSAVKGAYAISGTPADCVKVALKSLMPAAPDVVFSGINAGYNAGYDIAYSGTIGAAMEAVLHGIPAIAFSESHDGCHEVTDKYLCAIMEELIDQPLYGEIWNVNFPGCPEAGFRGIIRDIEPAPNFFFDNDYNSAEEKNGYVLTPYARLLGPDDAPRGSDVWAVLNGYIAIGRIRNMVYRIVGL